MTQAHDVAATRWDESEERRVSLVDLLDRVLADGVVIGGDLILSIDDVDLVRVSLHAVVSSISALEAVGE
jgi:hypothetical protein